MGNHYCSAITYCIYVHLLGPSFPFRPRHKLDWKNQLVERVNSPLICGRGFASLEAQMLILQNHPANIVL